MKIQLLVINCNIIKKTLKRVPSKFPKNRQKQTFPTSKKPQKIKSIKHNTITMYKFNI